jgi:hypothetical protein
MKNFNIILLLLLLTTNLNAQLYPGGGVLDPTIPKKMTIEGVKISEIHFFKKIKELKKSCSIELDIKPESYIGFYETFKDEILNFDPSKVIDEPKRQCKESTNEETCMKQIKELALKCFTSDIEFNKHIETLVGQSLVFRAYLDQEKVESQTIINFYRVLVYGKD